MSQARYTIKYVESIKISWLGYKSTTHFMDCKTKEELNIYLDLMKEDTTISSVVATDNASRKIVFPL